MTKQILFLISDTLTSGDGSSMDLFVQADNETRALGFWRDYYDLDDSDKPERLIVVPEAPYVTMGGPIGWDSVTQVVYDCEARKSAGLNADDDVKARGVIASLTEREG